MNSKISSGIAEGKKTKSIFDKLFIILKNTVWLILIFQHQSQIIFL